MDSMVNPFACMNCGGEMKVQAHTHVEKVGEYRVIIQAGPVPTCAACGEWEMPMARLKAIEVRSALTVLLEKRNMSSGVLKYVRRVLGLRQQDLGRLIGHNPQVISRWENGADEIPRDVHVAMVGLLKLAETGATPEGLLRALDAPADGPSELTAEPPPEPPQLSQEFRAAV